MAADLYLLGAGIRGILQLTRETIQALQICRVAFVLHDDAMVLEGLREYCADVRDLASRYSPQRKRADVYREISEELVAEAAQQPGVAFVVHGHPLFLVSASEYTIALAHGRGLRVELLPAISSFDTLLCDLGIDYGYGLQMFDSTTMIVSGWTPNPSVPLLVFQLSTTLNDTVVQGDPESNVLTPLVRHLSQAYSPGHLCTVVHSASHLLECSEKLTVPLRDLDRTDAVELWKRPTLYVPPVV